MLNYSLKFLLFDQIKGIINMEKKGINFDSLR